MARPQSQLRWQTPAEFAATLTLAPGSGAALRKRAPRRRPSLNPPTRVAKTSETNLAIG